MNNYILLQSNDLHVQYLNFYLLRVTRILANLNVDEEEIFSHFSVSIQFSGRITATIATRQSPNTCLKFIVGDIVQIIGKAMKSNHRLNGFEIIKGNFPSIRFTMRGKCSFRYGVKQHIRIIGIIIIFMF